MNGQETHEKMLNTINIREMHNKRKIDSISHSLGGKIMPSDGEDVEQQELSSTLVRM